MVATAVRKKFEASEKWERFALQMQNLASDGAFTSKDFSAEKPSKLKVASFFAGAGGMDLGLKWAGFDLVYANEIDVNATATYRANLGDHIDNRSIVDVDLNELPDHDLLVGGFPCQPFSYAGKRKGLRDERGMLFFALIDDLMIHRPSFFIFENVKGLTTHDNGQTMQNVKQAISDAGYRLSYSVLNAEDFLVPQSRQRLFLVGVRDDLDGTFDFPEVRFENISVKEAIDDLISNKTVSNNEPMRHSQRIIDRYHFIPQGGDMRDVPPEHQQRKRGQSDVVSGKQSSQSYHRLSEAETSPTVCAMFQAHFIHYSEHRNLTAREAARLQSFPDDFVFLRNRVNMSWDKDLSQYQQIGNAVPPMLAFSLGSALYDQFYESNISSSTDDPGAYFL